MKKTKILTPEEIRDAVWEFIQQHEKGCTTTGAPGTPCWGERCSIIAFLCHTLGVRHNHIPKMLELLKYYDDNCPDCIGHRPVNPN